MVLPVVALAGTTALMVVGLHVLTIAVIPSTVTVLGPSSVPKPVPAMETEAPTGPAFGVKVVMIGSAGTTVIAVEPQIVPAHALIVAEPTAKPKATPRFPESFDMVMTGVFEELHATEAKVCVLLSLNVPVAIKDCGVPAGIEELRGLREIDTRLVGTNDAGSYNSALDKARGLSLNPPATNTAPFTSKVAVCTWRATFRLPVGLNVAATGS
jgi:hypothetical protein